MGSGLLALELFWLTVGPSSAVFILGRSVDDVCCCRSKENTWAYNRMAQQQL